MKNECYIQQLSQLVEEEGLKSQRKIVAYVKEDKDYEDKHLFYLEYCPLINCLQ